MCTVSMMGDQFARTVPQQYPWAIQQPWPVVSPSRAEFDALKHEVEALKELLKAAKKYDEETGQPDCEAADKVALLRQIAELVGVDLEDVLG